LIEKKDHISYEDICQCFRVKNEHYYIIRLLVTGQYDKAMYIITEEAEQLDISDVKKHIYEYIFTRIAPESVLTYTQVSKLARYMSYYDHGFKNAQSYFMYYFDIIKDEIFMQSWIEACDIPYNSTDNKNQSLLKKAIWNHKPRIVHMLLQSPYIDIREMYAFYKMCKADHITSSGMYIKYQHPLTKQYAQWIFNLKRYRNTLSETCTYIQCIDNTSAKPLQPYQYVKIGKSRKLQNVIRKRIKKNLHKKRMSDCIRKQYAYLTFHPLPQEISHTIASYLDVRSPVNATQI
jgi:hypothetical protein